MKRNDLIGFAIIFIGFLLFAFWYTRKEVNYFSENTVFVTGIVSKVEVDYKKRPYIYYYYDVNGKHYIGNNSYVEFKSGVAPFLVGKSFPVICRIDNPEKSKILISRAQYKYLNLPFPDSLKWTIILEFP